MTTSLVLYGTKEWLARLTPELRPIANVRGSIVVRLPSGAFRKIIGGSPERPLLLELTNKEKLAIRQTLALVHRSPRVIIGQESVTWVDWYNTSATKAEQDTFDRVTKEIDAAGRDGLPGGSKAGIIDTYRFTYPSIYPALLNYRDTGGRRALFAQKTPNYGPDPISRPKPGGPIEQTKDGSIVLHPGRYTYSDPAQSQAFKLWLDFVTKNRAVQVLRTQVSEGLGTGPMTLNLPNPLSTPYYTDYEFLVAADVPWNPSIPGIPTWLPVNTDAVSYWGKPTPSARPDIDPLIDAAKQAAEFGKKILTLGVILGAGILLMRFTPSVGESHKTAHAT